MRDVGHIDEDGEATEVPSDFVLMPAPRNKASTNDIVLGGGGGASSSSSGVVAATTISKQEHNTEDGKKPSHGTTMSKLQQKIASAGLLDDEYDYEKHLKTITGSGVFFSGDTGHVASATADARARDKPIIESDVNEVSRQLDSIALTPDCMDDDVAQALFGDFDGAEFEEILDDFCITANMEPEPDANGEGKDAAAFDYDEHIRSLIEKAEKAAKGGEFDPNAAPENHPAWSASAHEFGAAKPLHMRAIDEDEEDDDEDDVHSLDREFGGDGEYYVDEEYEYEEDYRAPGVASSLPPDQERALREKFEQTLAEYDSDEVGDLDEECEDIRGEVELEDNPQLEAAFDDFLKEKKDEIFIEGTKHLPENKRVGGSGYSALLGGKMVRADDLAGAGSDFDDEEAKVEAAAQFQEELAEAEEILANPEMEPAPFEDVLIDGKSYFSERHQNPFDCESILTTYSNLDNNPAVVARSGRRNGRGKKGSRVRVGSNLPEEEPVQFMLSSKTGLPLGVLGKDDDDNSDQDEWGDDTFVSVNKGEARAKNETKAEKKARKNAVKEERRIARMQKKMVKEAFAEEFDRRAEAVGDNELAGKSIHRIA